MHVPTIYKPHTGPNSFWAWIPGMRKDEPHAAPGDALVGLGVAPSLASQTASSPSLAASATDLLERRWSKPALSITGVSSSTQHLIAPKCVMQ